VNGREPQGIVPPDEFEFERKQLRARIEKMAGQDGELLGNKTYISEDIYPDGFVGDDPDLYVYFGDLLWRSAGTVGHNKIFLEKNDTGPDDAVHAKQGLFIGTNKKNYLELEDKSDSTIVEMLNANEIRQFRIYDIFPTILKHFGLEPEEKMRGKPIKID
jgi:predicted AlkP superfamily phosphohydrolase/phosphomutase